MEKAHAINGVPGRLFWSERAEGQLFATQQWVSQPRPASEYEPGARISVEIRFDDSCRNGHMSFAVTGEVMSVIRRHRDRMIAGGCIHDDIAKHFPELAPLIKWHLCSTDGPMHYISNTVYLAGDRDCWGTRKGEPRQFATVIQFGDNPIKHSFGAHVHDRFVKFLQEHKPLYGSKPYDFEVIAVPHKESGQPRYSHKFGPKYTYGGYAAEWYECPFDSEGRARDFLQAMQTCRPRFVEVPTAWGEGKERQLDAARQAAVWPDAPDEILCAEPERLRHALRVRLPRLIEDMRRDVTAAGFEWVELPAKQEEPAP